MSDFDRIRWRCRRGLLELDLVLHAYLRDAYGRLDADGQAAFRRMLEADDNDLWDWVSGRADPADTAARAIVDELRRVEPGRQAA